MIIGNSAAGLSAARTLRSKAQYARVTVVGDEGKTAYCRCRLPDILAGTAGFDRIVLKHEDFYGREGINQVASKAVEIFPDRRSVLLQEGRELPYDKLLVATGAVPEMPDLPGSDLNGISGFRNYADARVAAAAAAMKTTHAVVLGGGLVSLKAAFALKKYGVQYVTVIVKSPHLMVKQLDEESATLLEKAFTSLGVEFVFGTDATSFVVAPGKDDMVRSVLLENGTEIPAQLVIVGKGTRPRTELVKAAGGQVNWGITVNQFLQTSLPNIYAAGDCIEVTDLLTGSKITSGLWPLAVEQGRYAAMNMLGFTCAYPSPLTAMNAVRFGNLSLVTAGQRDRGEQLVVSHPATGRLKKFFVQEDRLLGYILIGDVTSAGVYTALIKSGRCIPGLAGLLQSEQLPLKVPGLKKSYRVYKAV